MKTIAIGLLQGLGGWLACSALLSWYLQSQGARATDTIGIAIFGGLFAWASFGLFVSSFGCWRERNIILERGATKPPVDGKQVVLVGTIEATGPRLQAPMDGADCAMYSYEMRFDSGQGKRRSFGTLARGFGLTPCRIVTKTGAYKLLVVPDLTAESSRTSTSARIANFLQYAKRTTFRKSNEAAKESIERWSDDDGSYRSDVAFHPLDGADTRDWIPDQQHVPVGARVCVFGLYSKARGGIVPAVSRPTRLICGNVEDVAATLKRQTVTRAVIAVFLAAPLVIAYWINR